MLSKHGIKPQNTRREMRAVKIFTRPLQAKIEDILNQAYIALAGFDKPFFQQRIQRVIHGAKIKI
jgi:hypothetical protein